MTYARKEQIGDAVLYLGDCLEVIPGLGKVDAVVTDPPYFAVKEDAWDNQWRNTDEFIIWSGTLAEQLRPKLADNGSVYWFASPKMAGRLEVELSRSFRVLNNIVWDKAGSRNGAAGTGIDVGALRAFWSANTERLIFAEKYNGDDAARDAAGFDDSCVAAKALIFGAYLKNEFAKAGATNKQISALFPSKTGGLTGCVSNWMIGLNVPTKQQYDKMRSYLNKGRYEYLRRDYEDMRRDYEDMRRPFYLSQEDEWGDVWRFPIARAAVHPAEKPLALMRNIVKTSSRDESLILDPFMGSGTTGVACAKLGRRFIGIEIEPKYFDIACKRIETAYKQPDLFIERPKPVQEAMAL